MQRYPTFQKSLTPHMATVNPEIFTRILFSRIASEDMFATLKIHDYSMIFLNQ